MGSAESKAEAEAKAKDKAECKAKSIMPRKFKYTSYQRLCELNFTGYYYIRDILINICMRLQILAT